MAKKQLNIQFSSTHLRKTSLSQRKLSVSAVRDTFTELSEIATESLKCSSRQFKSVVQFRVEIRIPTKNICRLHMSQCDSGKITPCR